LKVAGWYVEHKEGLRKVGYGALFVFDVLTLGFGLYGYADYFLISWNRDLALRQNAVVPLVSHDAVLRQAPQSLGAVFVEAFAGTGSKYDFVSRVRNPNQNWYANVTYQFVSQAGATKPKEGFILPAEQKYLADFGVDVTVPPGHPELQMIQTAWHRVDRHVVRDVNTWAHEHLNFVLSNVTHDIAFAGGTIARTSFDIENRSAYGYWHPGLVVALLRGDTPVAANYVTVNNFDAGEKRHIEVNWFDSLPPSTSVSIEPDVNIFDLNTYLPPRAN